MTFKTTSYDSAEFLESKVAIEEYLAGAFGTGDPAFIARCLGTIARARNMNQLSRNVGMSQAELQTALSGEGHPAFSTILKVLEALGITLKPQTSRDRRPAAE